jgi:hypothetical protein
MNNADQFKTPLLQRRRGWLQAAGAVGLLSLTCGGGYAWSKSGQAEQAVEALSWDKLIPTGWRPSPHLQLLANKISSLIDDSPQSQAYMRALRKEWDNAPTRDDLDGRRIKIPGFVVAIGSDTQHKKSFLLVPYFGACVHTPPPPANQIIHVTPAKPVSFPTMETVWVQGVIRANKSINGESVTGYDMGQAKVTLYRD